MEAAALIQVGELIELHYNQAWNLQVEYEARCWVRLAMYAGICDSMERVPLAELKLKLRQVRRYAAALPPGLRSACRRYPRALLKPEQHWPCCPQFVALARFSVPYDPYCGRGPWDLGEDE